MQILGICKYDGDGDSFLETLKWLQNAQLHIPAVVTLEYDYITNCDRISIFPALYSIDRHPTIHQILAKSVGGLPALSIYLVDSCDVPSIHVLTTNMTMKFSEIVYLILCFENPCEIVSFLLTITVLELKSIRMISAITGREENYFFIT